MNKNIFKNGGKFQIGKWKVDPKININKWSEIKCYYYPNEKKNAKIYINGIKYTITFSRKLLNIIFKVKILYKLFKPKAKI